jgi:hypothetical protein
MYTTQKYTVAFVVAAALAAAPLFAGMAYASAPKVRAVQDGAVIDTDTPGDLSGNIDCVGIIETAEDAAYAICYLVPGGVPPPNYKTDASVVSQTANSEACPPIGEVGAEDECFVSEFDIGLFDPTGEWHFVIEFYNAQDQIINVEGIDFRVNSFFVLPESPVGVAALIVSSLAVLGGFMFLRNRNRTANLPI